MNSLILPKLFGLDKNGKEREWSIKVEGNKVIKAYGVTNGKLIISEREFEGKNIGKKNETTANQQAILVAQRDWISQINDGYAPRAKTGPDFELYNKVVEQQKEQGGKNYNLAKIFDVEEGATKEAVKKAVAPKTQKSVGSANGVVPDFDGSKYKAMLADTWEYNAPTKKYFDFQKGVYIQPKLDGIRCLVIYDPDTDKIILLSREAKQFTWLNHLRDGAYKVLKPIWSTGKRIILDCEIYAFQIQGEMIIKGTTKNKKVEYFKSNEFLDKDAKFQYISSASRTNRTVPQTLEEQLQLHVFDIIDLDNLNMNQDERFEKRDYIFTCIDKIKHLIDLPLVKVETVTIHFEKDIELIHNMYLDQGYEGVVLRAKDLKYQFGVRSKKLRKHKNFIDTEFVVTGIDFDPGVPKEQFTWVCIVKVNDVILNFKAKPIGNKALKEYWFDNYELFKGKKLTVRYQDLTADGKPRFGRGIAFREEGV